MNEDILFRWIIFAIMLIAISNMGFSFTAWPEYDVNRMDYLSIVTDINLLPFCAILAFRSSKHWFRDDDHLFLTVYIQLSLGVISSILQTVLLGIWTSQASSDTRSRLLAGIILLWIEVLLRLIATVVLTILASGRLMEVLPWGKESKNAKLKHLRSLYYAPPTKERYNEFKRAYGSFQYDNPAFDSITKVLTLKYINSMLLKRTDEAIKKINESENKRSKVTILDCDHCGKNLKIDPITDKPYRSDSLCYSTTDNRTYLHEVCLPYYVMGLDSHHSLKDLMQ